VPTIDERVVSMAFENQVFEQRVAQTMTTLGKLDVAIKNIGSTQGLANIEAAANKVTLQGPMSALDKLKAKLSIFGKGSSDGFSEIERASNKVTLEGTGKAIDKTQAKLDQLGAGSTFSDIEKASQQVELRGLTSALDIVANKFTMLQGVATVALGNIASQAAMKGAAFAKSFALGPAQQGFEEYKTNLSSIQTILANTEGQQVSGLEAVKQHLGELNEYSDQTIYNFSEMAKNIGTFTAAGVDLETSTQSIKGIANLAALSGSNSQQASTAMYQLSQAIAAGRVGLQDWNSVVNAGMGGAVFQKALMRTAETMGSIEKGAVKIDKATGKATINGENFRNSIMAKPGEESWLTSEVLTTTLKNFTGDMKEADLIAQGFSANQAKAIMQQAKTAKAAATEVKNISQVFDIARETIGSGWAKTFELVFGDFEQAKKTFTAMSNFINGFVNKTSDARNELLKGWSDMGGRQALIDGITIAWDNLSKVLSAVKDGFRQIFPPTTSAQLFDLTLAFGELMSKLTPSPELLDRLQRIFAGLFAVVDIGWEIIKQLAGVIGDLLGVVGKGSGGFLEFVANIADFVVSIRDALVEGRLLEGFFNGLSAILQAPLRVIQNLASAFASLFGGGGEDTRPLMDRREELLKFGKVLTPVERLVMNVKNAWQKLVGAFEAAKNVLEPWFSGVVEKLKGLGDILAQAFENFDFNTALQALQTGFIGGIFIMLKKALGGGGVLGSLSESLGGVNELIGSFTGKMEAMQSKLHAEALLAIAGAIAILAAGIYVLSTIDGDKMAKAMTAVAIGLAELMGALKLMTTGMGKMGVLQLPVIAAGLIGVATAVLILSAAMKIFATMSWEDIGKGLTGVAGGLAAIAAGMLLMPPTLPVTAAGLILVGVALNLIAAAIMAFGSLSWDEIGKGLFVLVDALGGIALGVSMMPSTLPLIAAGLILMGIALSFIAGAIKKMGELDFMTIIKGLGSMMIALTGIGIAMWLMPPNMVAIGAGLILVGIGLSAIGKAIEIMGGISIWGLIKGLTALGLTLGILAVGLIFMQGTLGGSVALLAAAAALAILAPTLAFMGQLKFSTIFKGLMAIALVLGTLALVGALAAAPLSALGVALLPLAGAFVVTAGAVFLFAKALSLLGADGGKGVAVMVTALTAFVALIPTLVIEFVKGLLSIVDQLTELLPKVVVALGVIIDTIILFLIENAPKLAIAIGILVDSIVQVLIENVPKLIATGVTLLMGFLNGLSQNIGAITTKVAEIITKFLQALTAQAPAVIKAGADLLVTFLQGVAQNVGRIVESVGKIITTFLNAVTRQIPKVTAAGVRLIVGFLNAIAQAVPRFIRAGTNIILGFLDGIQKAIPRLVTKGLAVARAFMNGIADGMVGLADIGFKAVIRLLNGLERSIRENDDVLIKAGKGVGDAIVDAIAKAISEGGGAIKDAIVDVMGGAVDKAKNFLGIKSPSKVFMDIGVMTMVGFQKGLEKQAPATKKAVDNSFGASGKGFVGLVKSVLGVHSPSTVMEEIGQDTMKGFAQGLRGGQADVNRAFKEMNTKLNEAQRGARKAIQENQRILDEERSQAQPDYEAIRAAEAAIARNEEVLRRTESAQRTLIGSLVVQKGKLMGLKGEYDSLTKKLEAAKSALDKLRSDKDQALSSYTDKYSATPTIDKESETMVWDYVDALQAQIDATKSYTETLAALREAGLDDTTYRKLLDEGLAGKEFAERLLAGGETAIAELGTLDKELLAASKTLAENASKELYDAGIQAAKSLVEGLKSERQNLAAEMDFMAKMMVQAIRKRLKMKSPSQIFVEIGRLTMEGLAQGLSEGSASVKTTMANTANNLVDATKSALAKVPSALSGIIDMDPTITPVLDLSTVEKDAQKLSDLTNVVPISAAASFGQASTVSQEVSAAQRVAAEEAAAAGVSFNYEQNNYSPEALSDVEIYRQTRNQLSQVKEGLGLVS